MNSGLLDMFHDGADHGGFAVADAIDIHFHRVFEEAVYQHWPVWRNLDRALHVSLQVLVVIDEFHGPAAQNKRRPNENWISDAIGNRDCFFHAHRRTVWRLA